MPTPHVWLKEAIEAATSEKAWPVGMTGTEAPPFVIYARAPDSARWLAFSEPIEMATGSFWAWQLTKHGQLIATVALALSLLLVPLALFIHPRPPISRL